MKRLKTVRQYRFTDAELIELADAKLDLAYRDAAEFLDRGYDANRLNDIRLARMAFVNCPTDHQQNGMKQIATYSKAQYRDQLLSATRRILIAAKYALSGSSNILKFGSPAIARLNDDDLFHQADLVLTSAREFQTELLREGITVAKLDAYELLIKAFRESQLGQGDMKYKRKTVTQQRITLGNTLYALIVQLCEVGKDIWYAENAAKYKHYVLYPPSPKRKEQPIEKLEASKEQAAPAEARTSVLPVAEAFKNDEIHVVKDVATSVFPQANVAFLDKSLLPVFLAAARGDSLTNYDYW